MRSLIARTVSSTACLRVGTVTEVQIEIIDLQPPHRGVTGFDDVFAAEPLWLGLSPPQKTLLDTMNSSRGQPRCLEDFAHDDFRLPGA